MKIAGKILLSLAALLASSPARAEMTPTEIQWLAFEKLCDASFYIKDFHLLVMSGISFQHTSHQTKKELRTFNKVTCPKNWNKLNGQKSIQEIIPEFQRLSAMSVKLKEQATQQSEKVINIYNRIATDLRPIEVDFGASSCGRALKGMLQIYRKESDSIYRRYNKIRACPAMAELEAIQKATAGAKHTYGESGGAQVRVPSGSSAKDASDVTGTRKAIEDKEKAKAILEKK